MTCAIILGTRPEIIKMSPIIRALARQRKPFTIIHTGQHYSYVMDRIFFDELELPSPDINLDVGSASHGIQTGLMLSRIEDILIKLKPEMVLVQGDTNTVVAGALAAVKLSIPVGHVEAGLRSYDRSMPEEINRIVADHIADHLFAPTQNAEAILLSEGIPRERILNTGNTVVDAVWQNLSIAKEKMAVSEIIGSQEKYFLATAHRQENVDNREKLLGIIDGLGAIGKHMDTPILFPIHPRTRKMLDAFSIEIPDYVRLLEPIGYLKFLALEANAKLILSDSGGIQEEACVLGVPCVTLRENTERPETVEVGANMLAGTDPRRILEAGLEMLSRNNLWEQPFGDGKSGERIAAFISNSEA